MKKRHLKFVHNIVDECTEYYGRIDTTLWTNVQNIVYQFSLAFFHVFLADFYIFICLLSLFYSLWD